MTTKTYRATTFIGLIMAFRMLGLFMILPVFTPLAHGFHDFSPALLGIALGVYGLTQACLQIPFGLLSDKIGRKPVIIAGLCLFALGSLLAARANTLHMLVWARALQGAGAVGSTLMALLADLTPENKRTKAMALMGMFIGLSFFVAMIVGPFVATWGGLAGIFNLTAGLAGVGIVMVLFFLPTTIRATSAKTLPAKLRSVLKNGTLLRLDLGIFSLHASLTALFFIIPILLHQHGFNLQSQSLFYMVILFSSFIAMIPFIIIAEKKGLMQPVFKSAIALLLLSQVLLWLGYHRFNTICAALFMFFFAFNLLEACLPSLVSKRCPKDSKGAAMGVYSSSQFLGIFTGGALSGCLYAHLGMPGIFYLVSGFCLVWMVVALAE